MVALHNSVPAYNCIFFRYYENLQNRKINSLGLLNIKGIAFVWLEAIIMYIILFLFLILLFLFCFITYILIQAYIHLTYIRYIYPTQKGTMLGTGQKNSLPLSVLRFLCKTFSKLLKFALPNTPLHRWFLKNWYIHIAIQMKNLYGFNLERAAKRPEKMQQIVQKESHETVQTIYLNNLNSLMDSILSVLPLFIIIVIIIIIIITLFYFIIQK